jgi:hypothetical protein
MVSSVGPSAPQFHELLLSLPSRLFSPLATLCLPLYETTSLRVKPSWQVTKLTLLAGSRFCQAYRSGLPARRAATDGLIKLQPCLPFLEEVRVADQGHLA